MFNSTNQKSKTEKFQKPIYVSIKISCKLQVVGHSTAKNPQYRNMCKVLPNSENNEQANPSPTLQYYSTVQNYRDLFQQNTLL
jgi:hypothetical protein